MNTIPKSFYRIVITTRGRTDAKSFTTQHFTQRMLENTTIVCQQEEAAHWEAYCGVMGCEHLVCPVYGLSRKRQWLTEYFADKYPVIVLSDDDLRFAYRAHGMADTRLEQADPAIVDRYVNQLAGELMVEGYGMAGFSSRSGNNRATERWELNNRALCIFAFSPRMFLNEGIRWDEMNHMSDFYALLSVMVRGYDVFVFNEFCHDQGSSNAPGGCSLYRTPDSLKESAERLAKLFPLFVKTKQKETASGWWKGQPRTDVTIQWKKAAAHGKANRHLI